METKWGVFRDVSKPKSVKYVNKGGRTLAEIEFTDSLANFLKNISDDQVSRTYLTFFTKWSTIIKYVNEVNTGGNGVTVDVTDVPKKFNITDSTLFRINNFGTIEKGQWIQDLKNKVYIKGQVTQ